MQKPFESTMPPTESVSREKGGVMGGGGGVAELQGMSWEPL